MSKNDRGDDQVVAVSELAAEKFEKARLPVDEVRVAIARSARELVEKKFALEDHERDTKRAARRAEVEAARLELANLELERKETVIRAHTDGVVTVGEVRVGDILEQGKAVLAIVQQRGFRIDVVVPSGDVGHLRVGMPARVKLDAYDYQEYGTLDGMVYMISEDSQVKEGQRGAVYTVKIQLSGSEVGRGGLRGHVKLGMAGQAEVVTGRQSLLSLLFQRIRQTISLG